MARGLCSKCQVLLTEENCYTQVFIRQSGHCKPCFLIRARLWSRKKYGYLPRGSRVAKGFCGGCKGILTKENCQPSIFKLQKGRCSSCCKTYKQDYYKKNRERILEKAKQDAFRFSDRTKKYRRSIKRRHDNLKRNMKKDGVSTEDVLWSLAFYTELVLSNECHYCLGSLSATGHGLDRMNNDLSHSCYNVVPCCESCNAKKNNDTSYEEMMLLAPVLREIKARRENRKQEIQIVNYANQY